jgi:TrpR-related protein YerC/YecD
MSVTVNSPSPKAPKSGGISRGKYYTQDINALIDVLVNCKDQDKAKQFLKDLFTHAEIRDLSNRWKVAKMLWNKVPYSQIERMTGMSSTTIARISKSLKQGTGYRNMIKKDLIAEDETAIS